jgi:wyosine [tRNA(Phe)-imidazoG37] synthetase (radical SAM superfamily)
MKGGLYFKLEPEELIRLPFGSRLFMLPSRRAVGLDEKTGSFKILKDVYGVAAFIAPAYTATYSVSYKEEGAPAMLPLFSYAACAFYKGKIYAAAVKTDNRHFHDPAFIDLAKVKKKAGRIKKLFPENRLIKHLVNCALRYGCPGAQNFFLGRYEGPLPTSPFCNAACAGCISYQPGKNCKASQPRIKFIPSAEEIAETALFHINRVKDPIVSFGQGCEGEPLLCGDVIEESIRLIRQKTAKGVINMNTNASRPEVLARLFDAGLDSIRVSLNSARKEYYLRYYKPKGYGFNDVLESIRIAKARGKFVSVNYLTMPGFTDSADEFKAFKEFISSYKIDMIQWRNLNFDPIRYFEILKAPPDRTKMLGVREIIEGLKKKFPDLVMGYYNPSKQGIR